MNESTALKEMESNPLEYRGVRVVTLRQIDEAHVRKQDTAGRNFRNHKHRLVQGEDYFEVHQPDEIFRAGFSRPQGGHHDRAGLGMARRGYARLGKSRQGYFSLPKFVRGVA